MCTECQTPKEERKKADTEAKTLEAKVNAKKAAIESSRGEGEGRC